MLVDIHDESLDKGRSDAATIARALGRLASLEVRLNEKAGELNRKVKLIGWIGVGLAFISAVEGGIQAYCAMSSRAQTQAVQPAVPPK